MKRFSIIPFVILFFVLSISVSNTHAEFIKDGDDKTFTGTIDVELGVKKNVDKLKLTNECKECDLAKAGLTEANLTGANLRGQT